MLLTKTKDCLIKYFEDKIADNEVVKTYFKHSAICKELHVSLCCEDDCQDREDDEDGDNGESSQN